MLTNCSYLVCHSFTIYWGIYQCHADRSWILLRFHLHEKYCHVLILRDLVARGSSPAKGSPADRDPVQEGQSLILLLHFVVSYVGVNLTY